jgi:23S rRNA (cytidine2498-2'-O)-methyltransferase
MDTPNERSGDFYMTEQHDRDIYKDINHAVVTIKPESKEVGINEIFIMDNKARVSNWLDDDVAVISLSKGYRHLVDMCKITPPMFVLHISPISKTIDILQVSTPESILEELKELFSLLSKELSFSVQFRVLQNSTANITLNQMEHFVSDKLLSQGFILDVKNPCQVVSINIKENNCHVGISFAKENLSNWTAGKHRFAKEEEQISRAEFKLLEAIEYFKLDIQASMKVLDMGASPGGWSRIFADRGCIVKAVDPANLDERLNTNEKISYFKGTIQEFLSINTQNHFDIIVNDMKMDAKESTHIMCNASNILSKSGLGIITLKLPRKFNMKKVKDCIKIMENCYKIMGARQLFHNRSELTVIITKK